MVIAHGLPAHPDVNFNHLAILSCVLLEASEFPRTSICNSELACTWILTIEGEYCLSRCTHQHSAIYGLWCYRLLAYVSYIFAGIFVKHP